MFDASLETFVMTKTIVYTSMHVMIFITTQMVASNLGLYTRYVMWQQDYFFHCPTQIPNQEQGIFSYCYHTGGDQSEGL